MKGAVHMGLAPFHNFAQLRPILNLLKRQLFNRRAGYYHTVKCAVANILKGFVKRKKVFCRGVFGNMAFCMQKFKVNL